VACNTFVTVAHDYYAANKWLRIPSSASRCRFRHVLPDFLGRRTFALPQTERHDHEPWFGNELPLATPPVQCQTVEEGMVAQGDLPCLFAIGRTGWSGRDDRRHGLYFRPPVHPPFSALVTWFHMSAPVRLYATRSKANSAVTLYNALAEDLAAEANGSTPAPRRRKRIKSEDGDEVSPTNSSVEDSGAATPKSRRPTRRVKVEHATDANVEDETTRPKRRTESSRTRAPKKQKPVQQALDKPHPAPEHWKEQYDTIKSMRARLTAPVDTMGCDQAQKGETDPKVHTCQVLPLKQLKLVPFRIVDLPLWCPLCFHRRRKTKSRMRQSRNSEPPWEVASPSTVSSAQMNLPSLGRLTRSGSGDARRGT